MRPVVVDGYALGGFAVSVGAVADAVEQGTGAVVAVGARPDVVALAGPLVGLAVRGRAAVLTRLRSLARVVRLCALAYATVERQVAASFHPGLAGPQVTADGDVLALLGTADPDDVEALLVSAPGLASLVVRSAGSLVPGSDAAELARLVRVPGSLVAVHAFLLGIGRRRLALLALLHPRLLADAPSAPVAARCRASRVLVSADLDRLLSRQVASRPGPALELLKRRVRQRRDWLTGTLLLRDARGGWVRRRRQLLDFDPTGDGRVIELIGDARRARHLAVFVPGTGSDLDRAEGTVQRMVPFVRADPRLAVVTWQNADFPDQPFDDGVLPLRRHVLAAGYRDAAQVAAPALARDVAGLHVTLPAASRDLTVLGHSYGGSIVGAAQQQGLDADRIVHVASAGAFVRRSTPVGPRPQVFSMTAYDDPIRLSQGYGVPDAARRWRAMSPALLDPAAGVVARLAGHAPGAPNAIGHGLDPDLLPGVVRLDTGRFDDSCRLVSGHSGMFEPGSTAWRNLLATMDAGRVEVLEPARWSSHLEPGSLVVRRSGVHLLVPHYVVDRTPWSDPAYRPPRLMVR